MLTSTANYELKSGTVGAILAGGVGVNKTGTGTVTLTGVNTYSGATSVAEALTLGNGTINPTVNSTYAIASGATLRVQYNTSGSAAQTWTKFSGAGTLALASGKNFDTGWGAVSFAAPSPARSPWSGGAPTRSRPRPTTTAWAGSPRWWSGPTATSGCGRTGSTCPRA
ncbi:MAG: hypothetical protein U1F77_18630 [Kiritimatiellia bacterium]